MPQIFTVLPMLVLVVATLLHCYLAISVYTDARIIQHNKGLFLVGPVGWMLITLISGLVSVALYWAVHHSTLRPSNGQ